MSMRNEILGNISRRLDAKSSISTRKQNVAQHMPAHQVGEQPKLLNPRSVTATFKSKVLASQASFSRIKSWSSLVNSVQKYLRAHNLPPHIRMGEDKMLVRWLSREIGTLAVHRGASTGHDQVCMSVANSAVAETGTLILASGPNNPTTLNFLPEHHIVVVRQNTIFSYYEQSWKRLRKLYGTGNLPRTVNMITGPSRSADIEQTLILGAHGPLALHVILIEDGNE